MTLTVMALSAIAIPFIGALLIILCPQKMDQKICLLSGGLSTILTIAVWVGLASSGGDTVNFVVAGIGGCEVMGLVLDKMSVMLATCFVSIGFLISIYSLGYMSSKNREHPDCPSRRFYAFFTLFIGAMAGLVYSSTVVGQLVFFEVTGLCSWGLIGYYNTDEAKRAAMKALILTHIASLGLYFAAGLLYLQTDTFSTSAIAGLSEYWKAVVLICILIAAWGKSAQLPFYMWLPSAMCAPTPVSAYLHGASMVKVGVAIFARALVSAGAIPEVVGWVSVIGAIITLIFSFFMYLPQEDMKKLLAFSTISQLSYIFLGFAFYIFGSNLALQGGVMHMFNHAFAKTLFFLTAGAFSFTLGTRMLPKLRGVLKKQPVLGIAFGVAALAIAGCPPMNGFFSKFAIFAGSFQAAAGNPILTFIVIVALIETVGCFAWFLKWMGQVLPGEPSPEVADASPLPKSMSGVIVVLIVMTFVSSFIAAAWIG